MQAWQQINLYDIFSKSEIKHLMKIKKDREAVETFLESRMVLIDEKTGMKGNNLKFWSYLLSYHLNK